MPSPQRHPLLSSLLAALLLAAPPSLRAHHGLDFLLVQDAFVPAPGKGVLYGGLDWTEINGTDRYGAEPGLMLGLLPGLAFGSGAEIADPGTGWQLFGLAPYLQFSLLPKSWSSRIRLAARVGYEFSVHPYTHTTLMPVTRTETLRRTETVRMARPAQTAANGGGNNSGGGGGPDSGPDAGPDQPRHATPRHGGHGHGGGGGASTTTLSQQVRTTTTTREITTYEEREFHQRIEGWNARLMLEADLTGSDRLVFNLVHLNLRSEKPAWGYAVGLRHAFHHDFAASVEALGDFNQGNWHQAVIALNYAPFHWGLLKLGTAFGLTRDTPDLSLITGFVLRF